MVLSNPGVQSFWTGLILLSFLRYITITAHRSERCRWARRGCDVKSPRCCCKSWNGGRDTAQNKDSVWRTLVCINEYFLSLVFDDEAVDKRVCVVHLSTVFQSLMSSIIGMKHPRIALTKPSKISFIIIINHAFTSFTVYKVLNCALDFCWSATVIFGSFTVKHWPGFSGFILHIPVWHETHFHMNSGWLHPAILSKPPPLYCTVLYEIRTE